MILLRRQWMKWIVLGILLALVTPMYAGTKKWDQHWKQRVDMRVQETAGLARRQFPVEIAAPIGAFPATRLKKELRVVALPDGKEVPSQLLKTRVTKGNTKARIAFLATLQPKQTRTYRVYFDNPSAKTPSYKTDLTTQPVEGFVEVKPRRPFALSIRNEHLRADLHPRSGQIGKLAFLKGTGKLRIFAGGANDSKVHFNPDLRNRKRLFDPPRRGLDRGWEYTHYWDPPPNHTLDVGPVLIRLKRWGPFTHNKEVYCSVTYTFYAHQPYFVVDTQLKMLEDYELEFLRDDEFGFKFGFNKALWKEKNGKVKGWDLTKQIPKGSVVHGVKIEANGILPLEPDCPWITFYHDKTGEGVGVIHTHYKNGAVGRVKMDPPMSFIHVRGAAYNYWGRVLAGRLHRLPQAQLPKGCEWNTQSAILFHRYNGNGQPQTLTQFERKLNHPLNITVVKTAGG